MVTEQRLEAWESGGSGFEFQLRYSSVGYTSLSLNSYLRNRAENAHFRRVVERIKLEDMGKASADSHPLKRTPRRGGKRSCLMGGTWGRGKGQRLV